MNTKTGDTVIQRKGEKTKYMNGESGEFYEDLTTSQQRQMQMDTSIDYQNFNRFLDEPLTFGKNVIPDGITLTNKQLAAMGILKEMDE